VALDQLTKMLIVENFTLFQSVVVIPGFFNLTYVTNPGAAFSLLAGADSWWRHPFFLLVGGVALLVLTVMYFHLRHKTPYQALALALIAGGALGNLIDRFRLGAVIDFIDIHWSNYHWPAFNVADSSICVGVGLFLFFSFFEKEKNV
jgi:signal peptidase II